MTKNNTWYSMQIILGSQSPRRKEILELFALPILQASSGFDESQVIFRGDPIEFVQEIAKRKAMCLTQRFSNIPILTADTVVLQEGRLFLKPETMDEARTMLFELSGKKHQVYTGVCVAKGSQSFVDHAKTTVEFHQLTDIQIKTYHCHIDPLDKAGGYAIQDGGALIVKRIEGCYYNVMGLPLEAVYHLLLKVGIDLWNHLKPSANMPV